MDVSNATPEQRSEWAKKAGLTRRRKAAMRELARIMLETELLDTDAVKEQLIERGFDPTGAGAILFAQLVKAGKGDTEAARFIRDTSGQKPQDGAHIDDYEDKPLESLDLTALTDDQLREMVEARALLTDGQEA